MFCQVKDKAKALKTDLVLDHAFYCKAVEIVMNERENHLRSFINLIMGGFYQLNNGWFSFRIFFLETLLVNVLQMGDFPILGSRLLVEDQASQMLKGKKMLNYIRVHLYLLKNISKRMLEAFGNGLVTRNEYRIYKELKENGEVQNLRQSKDTESFE